MAQENHSRRGLEGVLTDDPDSFAMISTAKQVDTAVVFIHGFRGSPDTTWSQFELIDRLGGGEASWVSSDMFFYGYKSVTTPILFSADNFLRFLRSVFPMPPSQLLSPKRPKSMLFLKEDSCNIRSDFSGYSRLIIVAHSEGAAVVRCALCHLGVEFADAVQLALDPTYRKIDLLGAEGAVLLKPGARRASNSPTRKSGNAAKSVTEYRAQIKQVETSVLHRPSFIALTASLKLFAPAHSGALITGKVGLLLSLFQSLYATFINTSTAAAELVKKAGVIPSLKSETEEFANAYPYLPAFRADTLWGDGDEIADKQKFRYDRFEVVAGKNHTSICKPRPDYLLPLKFVQREPYAGSATV